MKRRISVLLVFVMLFLSCSGISAQSISNQQDQVLRESGYSEMIIEAMDPLYKMSLVEALTEEPENVQTTIGTLRVSLLEELLRFLATTDEEYLAAGIPEDTIRTKREDVARILKMDDAAASEHLGINLRELAEVREFIASEENQTVDEVIQQFRMARGTISTSTMNFYVTAQDKSSGSLIKYNINITFAWEKPFLMDMFSDCIAVGWGGDLTEDNISSGTVAYYQFSKPNTWKEFFKHGQMTLEEEIANSALAFTFPQETSGVALAKHGTVSFSLSRNHAQGENTYVIARYGHKTIAFTGLGLDWSKRGGSVSPSFGTGYDQTSVEAGKVAIRY